MISKNSKPKKNKNLAKPKDISESKVYQERLNSIVTCPSCKGNVIPENCSFCGGHRKVSYRKSESFKK
jgi:DnaJ-class molecular chaperone